METNIILAGILILDSFFLASRQTQGSFYLEQSYVQLILWRQIV